MDEKYEVWREVRRVTEWREGAVFRTEVIEKGWYDKDAVEANSPYRTNLIYSVPSTRDESAPKVLIRRKKP